MKRIVIEPRKDWVKKLEALSFEFHSLENVYWDESAYYEFSMDEVLKIESATNVLGEMMLKAVQHVIDHNLYEKLHINPNLVDLIQRSWNEEEPSVYGRFDLSFNEGKVKLLEFNADTPTSLYEAAVIQWYWLQEIDKSKDQFNSIHEKLIEYWSSIRVYLNNEILHFACTKDSIEDFTTVEYLRDTASQAGLKTKFLYVPEIGFSDGAFVDNENMPILNIFKLYPWEWLSNEEFGDSLGDEEVGTRWIEPAWKSILSNKGILPLLYELFPDSPYILPCYFDEPKGLKSYVKKPIYSREGANITIVEGGETRIETPGEYGEEGFVYQELSQLPVFDGNCLVIGSWLINQKAAGMGIRESKGLITDNFSRFIPHLIN